MTEKEPIPPADFEAALTEKQVKEFGEPDLFCVERRTMLVTLARSGPQLMEGFKDDSDGEVLLSICDGLDAYKKHLELALSLTDSAMARLLVVGLNIGAQRGEAA